MPTNQHEKSQKNTETHGIPTAKKYHTTSFPKCIRQYFYYYCTTMKKSKFTLCEKSNFCPKNRIETKTYFEFFDIPP